MQQVFRPISRAVEAIRCKQPRLPQHRSPLSTTAGPTTAGGQSHHHHYYYSKHNTPRRFWFWTLVGGGLGYSVMAGGDSRCKTKRRTGRAFRDVEVKHRELKDDLNRLQLSLDQVRGQAMVHRPSLQDIYLRQHIEAVNQ